MKRLQAIWNCCHTAPDPAARRGLPAQRPSRQAERTLRKTVVAFRRWTNKLDMPRTRSARLLGIAPRTLQYWEEHWNDERLPLLPRGRRVRISHRFTRNDVIDLIRALGPHVGIPTLEIFFPLLARRELQNLLHRFRLVYSREHPIFVHTLHWFRPGSVWAADYTDPPAPIDTLYPHILVVRDLASGYQLLALPTPDQTADTTCNALLPLFRQFDAPIVLKSDNGSHFDAHQCIQLLADWNICPLFSPPETPEYNGAAEAGIGSLKTRAHHYAAHLGRPGEWNCDDVEAARLLANATSRPWGHHAPTPHVAWNHRTEISHQDRDLFSDTLQRFRCDMQREALADEQPFSNINHRAPDCPFSNPMPPMSQRTLFGNLDMPVHQTATAASATDSPSARPRPDAALLERVAIRRSLVACGYLSLTGRYITPPIITQKRARIT